VSQGSGGHRRRVVAALAFAIAAAAPSTATAAVPYTVVYGDTLSGIAAANGITAESLASWNGIALDGLLLEGQSLQVPSAAELGISSTTTTTATATAGTVTTPAPAAPTSWTTPIYSPLGAASLASNAAVAWEALRQAGLATYGIDIYPGGSLSAYRTYEQQAYLYDLYLSGVGAPANPPGTSSHEYGTAVDLASPEMRIVIDNLGPAYGWGKVNGPDEWWHVDYVGG
jgi:murein DD-endopeptidase MepM/ murein hydrolase activator NlpD